MVEEDQVSAARLQNSGGKVENPEEKRLNNHIQSFIKCFLIFCLTCRLVSVTLFPVFVCFHTNLDWFHVSPVTLSAAFRSKLDVGFSLGKSQTSDLQKFQVRRQILTKNMADNASLKSEHTTKASFQICLNLCPNPVVSLRCPHIFDHVLHLPIKGF